MLISKIISILFFITIFSLSVYSQSFIGGKVVDILDGRTIIIETAKDTQINFRLQNIEVPEPEQQLHTIVKDHLRKLTVSKIVKIKTTGLLNGLIAGVATIDGIDITQQMLRDGAAWLEPNSINMVDYSSAESLAKSEKRGIWGIETLKPAWEFRLEKAEQEFIKQRAIDNEKQLDKNLEIVMKPKVEPIIEQPKPLKVDIAKPVPVVDVGQNFVIEYDSSLNKTFVSSQMETFEFTDNSIAINVLLGFGFEYIGKTIPKNNNDFGFTVGSNVIGVEVLKANSVTIIGDDKKKIILSKPQIKSSVQNGKAIEILFYRINRPQMQKLAKSKSATIKIGKYEKLLGSSTLAVIEILLRQKT
jgi:micrococcal nuclease